MTSLPTLFYFTQTNFANANTIEIAARKESFRKRKR